jgi:hypothetical protein
MRQYYPAVLIVAALCTAVPSLAQTAPVPQNGVATLNLRRNNPRFPVDPVRRAAINAEFGLPADADPRILCSMVQGAQPDCGYSLPGSTRTAIAPETMARLRERGLLPSGAPPPPPAPQTDPPGEILSTSPLTNSVLRDR